jgi:3-dehydroquinate synthase
MSLGHGKLDWGDDADATLRVAVTRQDTYPMVIARGTFETLPSVVDAVGDRDALFVITDSNVGELLLQRTIDLFADRAGRIETIVIPAGETSKSWRAAQTVIDALSRRGAKRRSVLVALGGGVVVDLVGFVASVFMRGLPYINVPTSLVAQLDGAIGGKTGVDYAGSKNLLGSFYHPAAVLIDPDLLWTLPEREIRSGLAEAVKVGILHPPLFTKLENLDSPSSEELDALTAIILDAVRYKMHLLRDDPFERSLVRLLNLGHSFGHALEAVTGFEVYRHGEAIAVGIALATVISCNRGLCTTQTRDRILACLVTCGLTISMQPSLLTPVWSEINVVRRIRNGALHEVLPVSVGQCVVVDEVAYDEFASAVRALASLSATLPDRTVAGLR